MHFLTSAADAARPARIVLALSLITAAAAVIVLAGHVASYFFLFDDFALNGQASRWPLRDWVATLLFGFYRPALFLLMRGAHGFFGWHAPQGYAAMLIGVHILNALLVGRLARRISGAVAAWPAAALFLLSPWSAEAVFWVSGGSTCWRPPARSSRCSAASPSAARIPLARVGGGRPDGVRHRYAPRAVRQGKRGDAERPVRPGRGRAAARRPLAACRRARDPDAGCDRGLPGAPADGPWRRSGAASTATGSR